MIENYISYLLRSYLAAASIDIECQLCDKLNRMAIPFSAKIGRHHIINGISLSKLYYCTHSNRRICERVFAKHNGNDVVTMTEVGAQIDESVKCSWDEWKMNTQSLMFIDGKTQTIHPIEENSNAWRMWECERKTEHTTRTRSSEQLTFDFFLFFKKSTIDRDTQSLYTHIGINLKQPSQDEPELFITQKLVFIIVTFLIQQKNWALIEWIFFFIGFRRERKEIRRK